VLLSELVWERSIYICIYIYIYIYIYKQIKTNHKKKQESARAHLAENANVFVFELNEEDLEAIAAVQVCFFFPTKKNAEVVLVAPSAEARALANI
jgi:hypothetical protein